MKAVLVELPEKNMAFGNRDRLKFQPYGQFGVIRVFYEKVEQTSGTHDPIVEKIAEILPAGKVLGRELWEFLAEHKLFSGHNGTASLALDGWVIDIEARFVPCMIFGFIELPKWLLASIDLTVYINGNLALRHTFW